MGGGGQGFILRINKPKKKGACSAGVRSASKTNSNKIISTTKMLLHYSHSSQTAEYMSHTVPLFCKMTIICFYFNAKNTFSTDVIEMQNVENNVPRLYLLI
jgi:hypothetical protein